MINEFEESEVFEEYSDISVILVYQTEFKIYAQSLITTSNQSVYLIRSPKENLKIIGKLQFQSYLNRL
jgi:hypothetical protein